MSAETVARTPERPAAHHEAPRPRHEHHEHVIKQAETDPNLQIERIANAQAAIAAESQAAQPATPQPVDDRPLLIDQSFKRSRMRDTIASVQSQLSPGEQRFSKLIHKPAVQKLSESASATVARPSGLLGGSLLAFVGSVGYQLITRIYDVPYNYSFVIVFFIGGFMSGTIIELALFRRVQRRRP